MANQSSNQALNSKMGGGIGALFGMSMGGLIGLGFDAAKNSGTKYSKIFSAIGALTLGVSGCVLGKENSSQAPGEQSLGMENIESGIVILTLGLSTGAGIAVLTPATIILEAANEYDISLDAESIANNTTHENLKKLTQKVLENPEAYQDLRNSLPSLKELLHRNQDPSTVKRK